jgi:ketosteroid isomerase-like protein
LAAAFSELNATMTSIAQVQTDGKIAWVIGTERASGKNKAGEPFTFDALATNIFEKEGNRWLMVSHHMGIIPK